MADKTPVLEAIERGLKALKEATLLALVGFLAWYLVPFIPKWASKLDGAQISEVNLAGVGFKLAQTEQKLEQAVKSVTSQKTAKDDVVSPEKKLVVEALENVQELRAQATQLQASPSSERPPKPLQAEPTPIRRSSSPFWVYLGVATGDALPAKNFKLAKLPVAGQQIEASTEVYKRSSSPVYKEGDGWLLGNTVGVVRSGQLVSVRRLERIESTQAGAEIVWAEVELVR